MGKHQMIKKLEIESRQVSHLKVSLYSFYKNNFTLRYETQINNKL